MAIRNVSLSGAIPRAGHLCGAALVISSVKGLLGVPENMVKGGSCMSGMHQMTLVPALVAPYL